MKLELFHNYENVLPQNDRDSATGILLKTFELPFHDLRFRVSIHH